VAQTERPAWFPTSLFPFESHFVEVDGCRVHHVDEGTGPTLLLLHGNPTWSFLYRDIIRGLRGQFRCVALDLPGFGLSTAPAGYGFTPAEHARVVERFVDVLRLDGFTPFVQDWGGPIGLSVAGRLATRVRALIIGNTFAWPVNGDPHFESFSKAMGGAAGGFFIRHFNAFVNLMIPMGVKRKKLPRAVMEAYRAPFRHASREPTHIFPREILASRDFLAQVERGLAALREKPALILWGDRDIAFRAIERARFEREFPRHRSIILKGAGHFIQEDAPEEIVEAVRAWWSSPEGASP